MKSLAKIDWSNELVKALIDAVQNKEDVWNKSHALYRSNNAQESAWVEISKSIGLEGRPTCVKGKWRDLRDTYRKKLKTDCGRSGDAGGVKKISRPWMQAMEFSKQGQMSHGTASNFSQYSERNEDLATLDCSQIDLDWESKAGDLTPMSPLLPTEEGGHRKGECVTVVAIASPIKKPNSLGRRKRKAIDDVDLAILEELKKTSQPTPLEIDEDEDSLFMKSLVPQIKRLNFKVKARVKCQIQQLLFETEFGESL